jgi:hypothetical protein
MNNTIRHLPNGDFEVIYPTPEQIAAQEQYIHEREAQRNRTFEEVDKK